MTITLTDKEAEALLECVDTALKQHGIRALAAANMVVGKINFARKQEQNEKNISPFNPPAAPDAASQLG